MTEGTRRFSCVFENIDPEHTFVLRPTAQKVGNIVNGLIEQSLKDVQSSVNAVSPIGFFLKGEGVLTTFSD